MPVNARARSFPVTIRETSSRPSGAASTPTLRRSRLTLGCANKASQQAEPIKRLVSGCRQVIAARNTYSRAKSAHLRTQKIAEPVVAARDQRPPARACGSWPPNRLARKTANLTQARKYPAYYPFRNDSETKDETQCNPTLAPQPPSASVGRP